MPNVTSVTPEQLDSMLKETEGPVLVEFYADWCPDCRAAGPVFEEVAGEMAGKAAFLRIDIQEYPEKAQEYEVRHIPHFILFENGAKLRDAVEITTKKDIMELLTGSA